MASTANAAMLWIYFIYFFLFFYICFSFFFFFLIVVFVGYATIDNSSCYGFRPLCIRCRQHPAGKRSLIILWSPVLHRNCQRIRSVRHVTTQTVTAVVHWEHVHSHLRQNTNHWVTGRQRHHINIFRTELRSCVEIEVAILGSSSLIVRTVSVNVKQHWTGTRWQSSGAVWKSRWTSWAPRH